MNEHVETVDVFGGQVLLRARGEGAPTSLTISAALLRAMHETLTRFDPRSELSRLNDDPRTAVPASKLLRRMAALVAWAGELSGGLVDATVLDAVEATGYTETLRRRLAPGELLAGLGDPRPATPDPRERWRDVAVVGDRIVRPPGVRLDSGGLGKGLAADLVAAQLRRHEAWAVSCLGDVRVGGTPRMVEIADPFGADPVAHVEVTDGAVATSGITGRAYAGPDGPAHHLIDPGRGVPAHTGIVQASALAPTAVEAEVRAKAALLAGPAHAAPHLPHGGVLVLCGGDVVRISAPTGHESAPHGVAA